MKRLLVVAVASLPLAALADDYLGTLKLPQSSQAPGLYSFATGPTAGPASSLYSDNSVRLKLGYKYSRYLSVEGEFVDFARPAADVFASPGNFASAFRSTGFGVDTIATLPVWRFSFYGRMGAYRGDRNGFGSYSTALLVDAGIGTASDAAIAMELGCDGVLMNTAIAKAADPVRMARAMKLGVEAGREAFLAGRMAKKPYEASPSSPESGLIQKTA